jgi:hypothetical protein
LDLRFQIFRLFLPGSLGRRRLVTVGRSLEAEM